MRRRVRANGPTGAALADAFLLALRPGQLRWLRQVIERDGRVTEAELTACPALRPLLAAGRGDALRLPRPTGAALLKRMDRIFGAGDVSSKIIEAAAQGECEAALSILRDHGGAFIAMTQGVEPAQRIAEAFPETATQSVLSLGLLRVVNALKTGDLARADVLMDEAARHFALPALEDCQPHHDPEMVCVLFMKAVYADDPVPDAAVEQLFATLRDLPADASLMRGLLYNVGLDILMRRNQIATADEAAQRALIHYTAAGETGLGFYIQLYLVIIALWQGDVARAGEAVAAAALALSEYSGHSANDTALFQSFSLIHQYETNAPSALVHHLVSGEENIPFGELWPTMAEPILGYGRRALARHATPAAALSWVRRWRLRQWRSHRFDALISVQEVLALQEMGRFQEADEVLAGVSGAESGDLLIARLTSALDRAPGSVELALKIKQAVDDPRHSLRQRLALTLIAAESAALRRNEREAARWLGAIAASPGRAQMACVLSEQKPRLARILSSRALRTELRRLPHLNRVMEQSLGDATPALPEGLTRQEYRVLLLLAEAQPNKMIAQRLGISLATVKFHVSNLLAKSGAPNRKALVVHGRAARWLDDQEPIPF